MGHRIFLLVSLSASALSGGETRGGTCGARPAVTAPNAGGSVVAVARRDDDGASRMAAIGIVWRKRMGMAAMHRSNSDGLAGQYVGMLIVLAMDPDYRCRRKLLGQRHRNCENEAQTIQGIPAPQVGPGRTSSKSMSCECFPLKCCLEAAARSRNQRRAAFDQTNQYLGSGNWTLVQCWQSLRCRHLMDIDCQEAVLISLAPRLGRAGVVEQAQSAYYVSACDHDLEDLNGKRHFGTAW